MILKTIENDKAKDFTERFEKMLESIDPSILDDIDHESFPTDIDNMKRNSVAYAKMRADWEFMSNEERIKKDDLRTSFHNEFMTSVKLLIRLANKYYDNKWSDLQEEAETMHRKEFGDIACYITYLICASNK
ncbi:MAG: hypothetical protein E7298_09140 [Lachnospiraceae bacterium]|nr:hypothetical protein [Lachnospiraceae bacterium]